MLVESTTGFVRPRGMKLGTILGELASQVKVISDWESRMGQNAELDV